MSFKFSKEDRTGFARLSKSGKTLKISFLPEIAGTFPRYHLILVKEIERLLKAHKSKKPAKPPFISIWLSRLSAEAQPALVEAEENELEKTPQP